MSAQKRVINLHIFNPIIVTADEYEEAMRELQTKALVDELSVGDKILVRILKANEYRYDEIRWYELTEEEREAHRRKND